MPINIESMTNDVTVYEGDLPLNEQQIEKLVKLILARLERKQREQQGMRAATAIRTAATPALWPDERGV